MRSRRGEGRTLSSQELAGHHLLDTVHVVIRNESFMTALTPIGPCLTAPPLSLLCLLAEHLRLQRLKVRIGKLGRLLTSALVGEVYRIRPTCSLFLFLFLPFPFAFSSSLAYLSASASSAPDRSCCRFRINACRPDSSLSPFRLPFLPEP